jgi:predicted  nucleic acid-binding Zn-ribbon protein
MTTAEKAIQVAALKKQIADLENKIDNFEIDEDKYDENYDEWLDEVYGEIMIGNISFLPSRILKELDPIAYRCGFSDYIDSLDIEDDEEYQELQTELEEAKEELAELEENE